MRRREVLQLCGGAALWPLAADAQFKVWRVGIITEGMRTPAYEGLMNGMRELGYVSGTDFVVEWRFANGRYTRIPGFVEEFVRLKVDLIFLGSPATVDPARQATSRIPIVMGYSTDPVGSGLVASLERPGANVTGMASSPADTSANQLELLKAAVPGLARVALLQNPDGPNRLDILGRAQAAAHKIGLAVAPIDARDLQDIDQAFAACAGQGIGAVIVAADGYFFLHRHSLADLALKSRLPSIFSQSEYAEAGGLLSYGDSLREFYRRAAGFVDRIFKGAKPGDLPIERPAKASLAINRRSANALRLTIPASLYASADEVFG
jgi:putative ABC transport system substrate-binding protein